MTLTVRYNQNIVRNLTNQLFLLLSTWSIEPSTQRNQLKLLFLTAVESFLKFDLRVDKNFFAFIIGLFSSNIWLSVKRSTSFYFYNELMNL